MRAHLTEAALWFGVIITSAMIVGLLAISLR